MHAVSFLTPAAFAGAEACEKYESAPVVNDETNEFAHG